MKTKRALYLLFIFFSLSAMGQKSDSLSFFTPAKTLHTNRFIAVSTGGLGLCAGSLVGLNTLWYSDYPRSSFHLFNDADEWLQMDKAGHVVTSYYIGRTGINLLRWSGVERKKAICFGGALGFVYQGTVELLDGFSTQWGFSWGDFSANTLGSIVLIGQELVWDEQRISLKYSYHQTNYPQYRPNLLGMTAIEQTIKDYNGQTYWLSANIGTFLNKENRFPRWLNVAVGYGAEGMTGAVFNPPFDKEGNQLPQFDRYRKFYFSLDADLTRIKTKSHFLKAVFNTIGFIKIPTPALELSEKGLKGHWIYF